jgi:hypothetical protein
MTEYSDHDGKSKTASGNDPEHYPEMNDSPDHHAVERAATHAEIVRRAHEIWLEQGSPANAAERNWLEAMQQLQNGGDTQNQLHDLHEKAGSVQR